MKITTKGRYALRAVINLSMNKEDGPVSIKTITDKENLSPIFLEQIFTKLKKAGILKSVRGAHGGFLMARKEDEITVRDILEAVDEGLELTPCSAEGNPEDCQMSHECICRHFWLDISAEIQNLIGKRTIDEIIKTYGSGC
jgi:Rrf2 family iron-sulfur cluster assembly transcriptional regulator